MSDKIQLRLEIKDGKKYIVDQDGREIEGLISLSSTTGAGDIDILSLSVHEYKDGEIIVSGGHN